MRMREERFEMKTNQKGKKLERLFLKMLFTGNNFGFKF